MKLIKTETITEDENKYIIETYDNGAVVKTLKSDPATYVEPIEIEEPIDTDEILAEVLLNQTKIKAKQEEQDEVLAMILLNEKKGE